MNYLFVVLFSFLLLSCAHVDRDVQAVSKKGPNSISQRDKIGASKLNVQSANYEYAGVVVIDEQTKNRCIVKDTSVLNAYKIQNSMDSGDPICDVEDLLSAQAATSQLTGESGVQVAMTGAELGLLALTGCVVGAGGRAIKETLSLGYRGVLSVRKLFGYEAQRAKVDENTSYAIGVGGAHFTVAGVVYTSAGLSVASTAGLATVIAVPTVFCYAPIDTAKAAGKYAGKSVQVILRKL